MILRVFHGLVVSGWLVAVGAGMILLERYSFLPGETGESGEFWPRDSTLTAMAGDRSTLVVSLHPDCPCSRATTEELNRLLAERPGALNVRALFVADQAGAENSYLWKTLRRIPNVELIADPKGIEARRFGFRTSGEVSLFGADGRLRFHGGVTLSRGHVGANPGSAAIVGALDVCSSPLVETPVFGCALFDSGLEAGLQ